MNQPGLSKQIIIIALLPALLVGFFLSLFYIYQALDSIDRSQQQYSNFVIREMTPITHHAIQTQDFATLRQLINASANIDEVSYVRISDAENTSLLIVDKRDLETFKKIPMLEFLLGKERYTSASSPVFERYQLADGSMFEQVLGNIEVLLDNRRVHDEKSRLIIQGGTIMLAILLLSSTLIYRISRKVTQPIKRLTDSVRRITAGDLDSHIPQSSTGELGILESCINQMKEELKTSQSDLEEQLDNYTNELQQTLEELEIRNAELDITRSKAIYANNAKSEFLANMSHEIRTPLSGIIGFSELLQGTRMSPQQKDYTTTIQKSARSLLEIINDILDLSKIESGKTEISASEFVLVDIVEDIINLLSPTALEKNIELFYRIDQDVDKVIKADPFRLHQILTNLIGNAIKFTDKGYVYLHITRGELENADTSIKFTVSDTGIGLSSDDKSSLFKAFTQADTSITRRFGGTGLGLVISRKLTMLMKGEIGFDSTHGEGSTFWFMIPVSVIPSEQKVSQLKGIRVALLCNHFIGQQAYRSMLESFGCSTRNYSLDIIENIDSISDNADIIITFLSRKDIMTPELMDTLAKTTMPLPSLLIASTRSHKELRTLQMGTFESALFSTEKIERVRLKMINTLNRNIEQLEQEEDNESTQLSHDWSDINILIVDDNEVNLRLAEIILHKHKARVTTAISGSQAIDYASMNSYDIIFMDLHMPGLDGYQSSSKIREITPGKQPVIIALTANALPSEKDKVMSSDMNGIIIKPVSDAIMQKVIAQWVLKGESGSIDYTLDDDSLSPLSNRQHQEDRIFSMALAKEFTGNNEELALELFTMLRAELDDYRNGINEALKNNDMATMRGHVHKLHGASRCCGTTELKEMSSRIEELIDNKMSFDAEHEVEQLMAAIDRVDNYEIPVAGKTETADSASDT